MNRSMIKIEAKEALVGKRLMFLLVILVVGVIGGIPGIGFLITPVLTAGLLLVSRQVLKGEEIQLEVIFTYFKDLEHALKIFLVGILVSIIVFVGLILFIIPGIIFALRYAQAIFIMSENKDMDVMEALRESQRMMDGYKMDLFIFGLSFIGHYLLGFITFGIYLLYALPYIMLSSHNYYLHLRQLKGMEQAPINAELI